MHQRYIPLIVLCRFQLQLWSSQAASFLFLFIREVGNAVPYNNTYN